MDKQDCISVTLKDGYVTKINTDFLWLLNRYTFRYADRGKSRYVVSATNRKGKRIPFVFHRMVMDAKKGDVVDHINGDTLDNRRENLRFVSSRQNACNATKKPSKHGNRFKGISTRTYGYASQIRVNGKILCLGTYKTDVEAAFAYDMASLEYHGEYGRRNFLPLVR